MHEIGHAIGLVHEHQLPNRDDYIDIIYANVAPSMRVWFQKYQSREVNQFDVNYELSSVMHYGTTVCDRFKTNQRLDLVKTISFLFFFITFSIFFFRPFLPMEDLPPFDQRTKRRRTSLERYGGKNLPSVTSRR